MRASRLAARADRSDALTRRYALADLHVHGGCVVRAGLEAPVLIDADREPSRSLPTDRAHRAGVACDDRRAVRRGDVDALMAG